MFRLDGQGHHPRVRPQNPNRKRERNRAKICVIVRQIPLIRFLRDTVVDEDCYVLGDLIETNLNVLSDTTLEEPMRVDMACVEVCDCGVTQANPSRPPPKHGWAYRIMRYAAVFFMGIFMALVSACKPDPVPGSDQPTPHNDTIPADTITPPPADTIIPTREIIIPWSWSSGDGLAPQMDTIKFYAMDPTVKYVVIYLVPGFQTTWEPRFYRIARDSLQTRIDVDSTKVKGRGIVKVGRDGAQIHPDTLTTKYGMWEPDSLWYTKHGWRIERYDKSR